MANQPLDRLLGLSRFEQASPFFQRRPKITQEQEKILQEITGVAQQGTSIFDVLRSTPIPVQMEPVIPEEQKSFTDNADFRLRAPEPEVKVTTRKEDTLQINIRTPQGVIEDIIQGDGTPDMIDINNLDFGEPIPLPRTDGAM